MASASVTGVLDTAATAGLVLSIPSPLELPLAQPPLSPSAYSYILFTPTGTLSGTWQASAINFETFTVLGTYTASQTIIPLPLPGPPPGQNWQAYGNGTAYTSGTATYTPQLPVLSYYTQAMSGGGTAATGDDNGQTFGGIFNIAGNGVEATLAALYGGGQTGATQVSASKMPTVVTTALLTADSVMLPTVGSNGVTVGHTKLIYNSTGVTVQVYGAGTDTIQGVATGTGVALATKHMGIYTCYSLATANLWCGFSASCA